MRIPSFPRSARSGINMTPMIDVVFLLIIFFLVSSHLARQESQLPIPLPIAPSGESDVEFDRPRLTLTAQSDGTLLLAGAPVAIDQLPERLARALESAGEDLEFRIRASRDLPYEAVEPIMVASARAGVWNLTFAVYESQPAQ